MSLYHCAGNGIFGRVGDYFWAASRGEAAVQFFKKYGSKPTRIEREK